MVLKALPCIAVGAKIARYEGHTTACTPPSCQRQAAHVGLMQLASLAALLLAWLFVFDITNKERASLEGFREGIVGAVPDPAQSQVADMRSKARVSGQCSAVGVTMQAWVFRGLWGPGCCACDVFARQLDSGVAAAVALHARPVALAAGLQQGSPVMVPRPQPGSAHTPADSSSTCTGRC